MSFQTWELLSEATLTNNLARYQKSEKQARRKHYTLFVRRKLFGKVYAILLADTSKNTIPKW